MSIVLNPRKRFDESKRINGSLGQKGIPKNTREALCIKKAYDDGIFLIDDRKKPYLYDRSYLVAQINFFNKNESERNLILTVTCRAEDHRDAQSYFSAMDFQMNEAMKTIGSFCTPLDTHQRLDGIRRFFYMNERTATLEAKNPLDDVVYDVIPTAIEAGERDFMIMNDRYVAMLYGASYDLSLPDDKTIYPLTRVDFPSYVTIDYAPVERAVFKEMLKSAQIGNERAIAQEMDAKKNAGQLLTGISYSKNRKRDELEEYRDQIDDNEENCHYIGLLVAVSADTEEELAQRVRKMQNTAKDSGIILENYSYQQLAAWNTALPIGCRLVNNMRPFFTSSATALHPFHAADLIEAGGQLYGINMTTNHLVFANRKNLQSPHGIVIGHTGGGKSFFLKTTEIAQTLLSTDDDLTCIDPQNEMEKVCEAFDGTFIDFTPKSEMHINPMEIPDGLFGKKEERQRQAFVADVSEWANSFCSAVMRGIDYTQEYSSVVSRAVRNVYDVAFKKRRQPTIVTLRDELKRIESTTDYQADAAMVHRIINSLEDYTEGTYDMFAYQTNVDLGNRFVVFGLNNVGQMVWEPVMITVMSFLSNRMEYNNKVRRATRLVVDETQVVTENPASAQILLKAVITYRKFGGICTLAMQNLTRALENRELRDMFSNCGYKCFFDQGGVDAHKLAEIQELSASEYRHLSGETPGQGVMIWGQKVILLNAQMETDNPLYPVFNTNFHEEVIHGD